LELKDTYSDIMSITALIKIFSAHFLSKKSTMNFNKKHVLYLVLRSIEIA